MHEYTGPHDYFNEAYVQEWERIANTRRPFRIQFFETFAMELAQIAEPRILEIGSGPGFLAEYLLGRLPITAYHLFDFSPPMLTLSRTRLAAFSDLIHFHQGSFLDAGWWQSLPGPFDAMISMQAIHEARQSERIPRLYTEMGLLLKAGGALLIADQVNNEVKNEAHLLTADEQMSALTQAGFQSVRQVYAAGDLAMFGARREPAGSV